MRRHVPKMAAKEENDLSTMELTKEKGEQAFQQVLSTAIKLPGVRIDRETFLRRELSKYCPADIVEAALMKNPAQAQIDQKIIDQIANSCISNETTRVTALSTAAGLPGGLAMVGTVPADLIQYFGHILRILQKLAYLYGWQNLLDGNAEIWMTRQLICSRYLLALCLEHRGLEKQLQRCPRQQRSVLKDAS